MTFARQAKGKEKKKKEHEEHEHEHEEHEDELHKWIKNEESSYGDFLQ